MKKKNYRAKLGKKASRPGLRAVSSEELKSYEAILAKPRKSFSQNKALLQVTNPNIAPELLELFLLNYSAFGVSMTAPVSEWIYRAGQRCKEVGLEKLGDTLCRHSAGEAGHDKLLVHDTHMLVARWNKTHPQILEAEQLFARPYPNGVIAYRELHETTIEGLFPYCQLAIELEIERLSLEHGPAFVKNCVKILGADILPAMSFVRGHIKVDVRHTHLNQTTLAELLSAHPEFLDPLAQAGEKALETYGQFLDDCFKLAQQFLNQLGGQSW